MSLSYCPTLPVAREEFQAQRIACTHLVRACEQALFDLSLEADTAGRSRVADRSVAILEDILDGWRDTLRVLRAITGPVSAIEEDHKVLRLVNSR